MLAAHPDIATSGEPWLLLPFLYSLRPEGVAAEYDHRTAARAIEEFCRYALPGGVDRYLEEGRQLYLSLTRAAAEGKRYFLDKTPRYHLVADELLRLFPEARFVFLWRHPLAIAASLIDSWNGGRWNLDAYAVDLYAGVERLTATFAAAGERAAEVRFEDLVRTPEVELDRVVSWLGLPPDGRLATAFADVPLPGSMGDAQGTARYRAVSQEPLEAWKRTLANPLRRAWARRYLRRLGSERLETQGYRLEELLDELAATRTSVDHLAGDVARTSYHASRRAAARFAAGRGRLPWPPTGSAWRWPE